MDNITEYILLCYLVKYVLGILSLENILLLYLDQCTMAVWMIVRIVQIILLGDSTHACVCHIVS